jgi:hypothetical protein
MFNSSFGKLSLTQPAFYIPQPQHSLVDVIFHSYGILPGQEPIFSVLVDYLLALNPSVRNPRMALGSQAPRTLDFISHDPQTILCMNPEVVKARIRQVVNGGGEFAMVDIARNFVPADPAERGVYEFLARHRFGCAGLFKRCTKPQCDGAFAAAKCRAPCGQVERAPIPVAPARSVE